MKQSVSFDTSLQAAHQLARPSSEFSMSELENGRDSSFETTPSSHRPSPTHSLCSEDIVTLDTCPNLTPVNRGDELSFDVIASVSESVGLFLACHIERFRSCAGSPFDALSEPKITLPCYFERIRHYSRATPETVLCAVVLIRRIARQTGLVLTSLNCHRLLVSAIMVFAKFYDDEIDSNARWARIAGVKKVEMNNLEVEFLNRCQFDLRVTPEEFHEIVFEIANFRNSPRASTEQDEDAAAAHHRSKVWSFHTSKDDKKIIRTKSHADGLVEHKPERSHTHKSIMAFFHHTNHAHLNRFPARASATCSPTSINLASPGMMSPMSMSGIPSTPAAYESAPPSPGSVTADSTPTSARMKQRPSLPRGPSLQHLAALLHGHSPFHRSQPHQQNMVAAHGY